MSENQLIIAYITMAFLFIIIMDVVQDMSDSDKRQAIEKCHTTMHGKSTEEIIQICGKLKTF